MKTAKKFFTILLLILVLPAPLFISASSDLNNQLNDVQRRMREIEQQKKSLEQSINSEKQKRGEVNNEISLIARERDLLQAEVDEKELRLQELNLQIEILTKSIEDNEAVIAKTELEVSQLNAKADKELTSMYLDIKTFNSGINLLFSDGKTDIVKTGLYKETIQDDTNNSLKQLKDKRVELNDAKSQLLEDKKSIETDKLSLDEEKRLLDTKKSELQGKLNKLYSLFNQSQRSIESGEKAYASLSEKEKDLQSQLESLKRKLSDSITAIPNGAYVTAGEVIGREGNTGVSTGPHLHFGVRINNGYTNPCGQLPFKQLRNASCGVSSPKLANWPMGGVPWLTSGFRTPSRSSHNAIDISLGGGTPIVAAHNGWISYGNDNSCSWYRGQFPCNGRGAKFAVICENKTNCAQGIKTEYWHLAE